MFIPANIPYSISKEAQVVLGHLRAEYSIAIEQAKKLYQIQSLPSVIDELLASGHVIFEVCVVVKEPSVKAYTLCEFRDHEPKKLEQLTKTKQRLFSPVCKYDKAS